MPPQRQHRKEELRQQVDMLQKELSDLKDEVSRMSQRLGSRLVPMRRVAEQENSLPGTYEGLKAWMERRSIPIRTRTGKPKPAGSKAASYVSMKEIRAEEPEMRNVCAEEPDVKQSLSR